MSDGFWRRCSSCKTEIGFDTDYWVCSVSTCSRKRTALAFCSVRCWESHLPFARHRDAWAEESRSPTAAQWTAQQQEEEAASSRRRLVRPARVAERGQPAVADLPRDALVVVSKVKTYVRAASGMNTSDKAVGVLSDHLRRLCERAAREAARDGRKTVLDRDFQAVLDRDFIERF